MIPEICRIRLELIEWCSCETLVWIRILLQVLNLREVGKNITSLKCAFFFPLEGMLTVSLSVKSDIITDDNIEHLVYSKIPITPT